MPDNHELMTGKQFCEVFRQELKEAVDSGVNSIRLYQRAINSGMQNPAVVSQNYLRNVGNRAPFIQYAGLRVSVSCCSDIEHGDYYRVDVVKARSNPVSQVPEITASAVDQEVSSRHQGEQVKLILKVMAELSKRKKGAASILSGDVDRFIADVLSGQEADDEQG